MWQASGIQHENLAFLVAAMPGRIVEEKHIAYGGNGTKNSLWFTSQRQLKWIKMAYAEMFGHEPKFHTGMGQN